MSERRTRSQTRESREEGIVVDPAGARDELPPGEGAVVLQQAVEPSLLSLQTMFMEMMRAQNEQKEQAKREMEETRRMMSSMQEQLRQVQQQEQPGQQLTPRQQLELEYEQEQEQLEERRRALQLRHEQRVAAMESRRGADPPPPPPAAAAAAAPPPPSAAATAILPPEGRGRVVGDRYVRREEAARMEAARPTPMRVEAARPTPVNIPPTPAPRMLDPVLEYRDAKAQGADTEKSDAASGGLRPNNWMIPDSVYTMESLSKKVDSLVSHYKPYDRAQTRLQQYHHELMLTLEFERLAPRYNANGEPVPFELHRVAKMIIYRIYSKSKHCGRKLFDMHPQAAHLVDLSYAEYEKKVLAKFESPTDLVTAQMEYETCQQRDYQEVSDYLDEKWARYVESNKHFIPDPQNVPQAALIQFRAGLVKGLKNPSVRKAAQDADPGRYASLEDIRKHLSELTSSEYERMRNDESVTNTYQGLYVAGRAGPWDKKAGVQGTKVVEDVGALGEQRSSTSRPAWRSGGGSYARGGRATSRIASGPNKGRMGSYRTDRVLATSNKEYGAKLRCFDCGGDHFKGDPACTSPGAKLDRNAPPVRRTALHGKVKAQGEIINQLMYVDEDEVEVLEDEFVLQLEDKVECQDAGDFLDQGQAADCAE